MEPVNYGLLFLGGGICVCVLIGVVVTRRAVRVKPVGLRLAVWLAAGLLCFGGSQILGRGFVGWWPFLGPPKTFIRLVKVKISPSSRRIALVAIGGHGGRAIRSAQRLFVADERGEQVVEVCEGNVRDICWSNDGEQLYVLRRGVAGKKRPSKSLWRYAPSTRKLSYVRALPRRTDRLSIDPADEKLLITTSPESGEGGKVVLLCGQIENDSEDRPLCWRKGWLGGHAWGPKTGSIFVATNEPSSFGDDRGLWVLTGGGKGSLQPTAILEMRGIERIRLNPAETHASLVVRRRPPPCLAFDLYVLELAEGFAAPVAIGVELASAAWDGEGKRLIFADTVGLKTYNVSTHRVRLLVEATPTRMNPSFPESLKALGCNPSGDVLFQRGMSKVEMYDSRTRRTRVVLHTRKLRRHFKEHTTKPALGMTIRKYERQSGAKETGATDP